MKLTKKQLEQRVIKAAREYGIHTVLYRNIVGDMLGVNVTDMECLGLLFFKGIATPGQLSQYTGLSTGATTAMLNRLERARLIKRLPNPHDRRGSLIKIDSRATKTVGPMFAGVRLDQDALMAGYSILELEIIFDFLQKFTDVWEKGRKSLSRQS